MYKGIKKKEKGEFTRCKVSSNYMSKPIHVKNGLLVVGWLYFFHIKN
jgi:hypothetical protein